MRAVFVHGSGRHGAAAWPGLVSEDYVFVTRSGFEGVPQRADFEADTRLVIDAVGKEAHVVAASYGGIAALQAAASAPGGTPSTRRSRRAIQALFRQRA